jgi:hypothetical protein
MELSNQLHVPTALTYYTDGTIGLKVRLDNQGRKISASAKNRTPVVLPKANH